MSPPAPRGTLPPTGWAAACPLCVGESQDRREESKVNNKKVFSPHPQELDLPPAHRRRRHRRIGPETNKNRQVETSLSMSHNMQYMDLGYYVVVIAIVSLFIQSSAIVGIYALH